MSKKFSRFLKKRSKSLFGRSARKGTNLILRWIIAGLLSVVLGTFGINAFVSATYNPNNIVQNGTFQESEGLVQTVYNTTIQHIGKAWNTLRNSLGFEDVGINTSSGTNLTDSLKSIIKTNQSSSSSDTEWTFDESSTLSDYYLVTGTSGIDTSTFPATGTISYGGLDSLGRTLEVKGSLTYADNVQPSYSYRGTFGADDNPSGWTTNEKVAIKWKSGKVYHGYFWNRSHLIADSLGGEATKQNAITGTRTQNVGGTDQNGGMRYPEKKAQNWIEEHHDGVLYYSATPVYNGNELVPRTVIVKMLSSDGSIDESVTVYNTANGYMINYATGAFTAEK